MERLQQTIKPFAPKFGLVLVIGIIIIFLLTLLGGRQVSTVFSTIDQGLSTGSAPAMRDMEGRNMPLPTAAMAPEAAPPMTMGEAEEAMAQSDSSQQFQRMVIKTASLSLEVKSVPEAEAAVTAQVNELQGYVVSVQTIGTGNNLYSTITFRVPAEHFEEALTRVQSLAKRVVSRTVGGDDVTEEYVDLDARVRNLEISRDRLRDLLNRASDVSDAISVNAALTEVQGQIEQIRGRMQYLERSTALSTIDVTLQAEPVTPVIPEDTWQPLEVARNAFRNLIVLGQTLVNLIIVLLVWTPLWLPLLLAALWYWRRHRGSSSGGGSPATPESV